jgi:hypothetical protein
MKRAGLFSTLILAGVCSMGCEHHAAITQYNPQLDSVLPTYYNAIPNMTILDDQRKIHDAMVAAHPGAAPAAPAGAPVAVPGGFSTPAVPPPPG